MITTEWREVPEYEDYAVSNQGQVARIRTANGKPMFRLKQSTDNGFGYRQVVFSKNGNPRSFRVHRLVMLAFCGHSDLEVNHKDGNKTNNCLDNLEYISRGDNIRHASQKLGAKYGVRGEKHYRAKLTKEDIKKIITMRNQRYSLRDIGKKFNVHFTTIRDIINGTTWK